VSARVPRLYRTEAVVLRQRRLGEADRIVTLFTADHGKLDAVAKGIRKQTSRKSGHLELLTWTSLLLAHGQNLDIVTQGQLVEGFMPLHDDLQRLARGMYVAELVDRFTEARSESRGLFRLLVETLQRLATAESIDLAVRYFELQLLSQLGYRPQLGRCVACAGALKPVMNAFNPALGGVVCPECKPGASGATSLSVNALKVMRLLQVGDHTTAARLKLPVALHTELEWTLRNYLRYLLERNPRSLEFVDAVRRTLDGTRRADAHADLCVVAEDGVIGYGVTSALPASSREPG
jgi:DNA repair protein RecO (recombination protein O)